MADGPGLLRMRWEQAAALMDNGSKSDSDQGARLREALAFSGSEQVDAYLNVFLTEALAPRKSVVTKKFCDNNPETGRLFESEADRIGPLIEKRRALPLRD